MAVKKINLRIYLSHLPGVPLIMTTVYMCVCTHNTLNFCINWS